ncbi:MAG: substrate-binding domain-containing protein [Armatimonadota bacterium]|nr:substrate-binding domain-containing protein [Armatimonadota bacterium]
MKVWLSLCVGFAVLAGCGGGAETPKSGGGGVQLKIAVIPKGATHEFWKSVRAGADEAGKELGVEILWKGPEKENNLEEQIKIVEDFTTMNVSGIVLAPLDDTGLRVPVSEAQKKNIPVVIFDSAINEVETVSFVATDNFKGGQMAGEEVLRLLNGNGRVIMMRCQEGSASTEEREAGFLDVMKKAPGITMVSDNQYGGATTESAQKTAENLLASFGGKFDAIFCSNESTTFGTLRAFEDAGVTGKVKFVGFDASAKLLDGLQAAKIDGLIVQNPRKMGYLGVKNMVAHIKGEPVEKRIDTGATLVTKANFAEDEIQILLGLK